MDASVRYRMSKTLILVPGSDALVLYNFLTHETLSCSNTILRWLESFSDWVSIDAVASRHSAIPRDELAGLVTRLAESGLIHAEGSDRAVREQEYEKSWEWGLAAGVFHFSTLDNSYLTEAASSQDCMARLASRPQPEMHMPAGSKRIFAPPKEHSRVYDTLHLLETRRSNRTPDRSRAVTIGDLTDCLYAGLGIVGHVKTETGNLPLKPTPSGGARNPFDAFVIIRECQGLKAGIYMYCGLDHSLAHVASEVPERLGLLVGDQAWADDMPVMIVLVASLERTMWKYSDANAYRVVLIEAGHIGQNIMVAATAMGLSVCPTAALSHSLVSDVLHLQGITHVPMYALTISWPGKNEDLFISNPLAGGSLSASGSLCAA